MTTSRARDWGLILVIGVGRSGTTLLQSMLHAHRAIVSTPELHFLSKYVVPEVRRGGWTTDDPETALRRLSDDEHLSRLDFDLSEVLGPYREEFRTFSYHEVFLRILDQHLTSAGREDVRFVAEKDPTNTQYIDELYWAFPHAHLIQIVRDPSDVLISRRRSAWGAKRGLWRHLIAGRVQLKSGRTLGRALFGSRYHELKYEELTTDPETVCRGICAFLDLSYDPAMLDFHQTSSQLVAKDELDWKGNVFTPVANRAGEGRLAMSSKTLSFLDGFFDDLIRDLGYREHGASRSWRGIGKLAATLVDIAWGVATTLRRVRRGPRSEATPT